MFRTPAEAAIALQRAKSELSWIILFARAAFIGFPLFMMVHFLLSKLGAPPPMSLGGLLLVAVLSFTVLSQLRRRGVRRLLRRDLVSLGVPVCIACGYNLAHFQSDCCPECGSIVGVPALEWFDALSDTQPIAPAPKRCASCGHRFTPWSVWRISRWTCIRCPACGQRLVRRVNIQAILVGSIPVATFFFILFLTSHNWVLAATLSVLSLPISWLLDVQIVRLVKAGPWRGVFGYAT